MTPKKKLIEVALPLDAINKASAREKSIRHGHPSTLHLWWARRPLAAARAVIFSQMVDDPSAHPDLFPTEKAQEKERQRLFRIIEELVQWENTTNEEVLHRARDVIWQSWRYTCAENADHPRARELFDRNTLPAFHDPFAGGGALPLEAQRLGLESHASDLNPVAVLINKAMIEIPPKFTSRPPVNPSTREQQTYLKREWKGAQGLAEDVRFYGKWMRDEAESRIGHLYPKVEITSEMARERPDLKPYVGQNLTVIAWIWARTVKSPNPAFAHVDVPLASTFLLSAKPGKEAYIEPVIEDGSYRFTVKVGKPKDADATKNGTKLTGANFVCLMSGAPIAGDYIKTVGKAGCMGARLMAIVAEGDRGRVYLPPTSDQEAAAREAKPEWKPDLSISGSTQYLGVKPYGMDRFDQIFTDRQLVALTTFSTLVQEAREQAKRDAYTAGIQEDGKPLAEGGNAAAAYADAVAVYLAFAVDKAAEGSTSLCTWSSLPTKLHVVSTFGRQALTMSWDYAEANVFADSSGNILRMAELSASAVERQSSSSAVSGESHQEDATHVDFPAPRVISTDPPYYDNVPYADLSDFFYVWLRRSLRPAFPDVFATLAVPKSEELVAFAYRHDSKASAEAFFLNGMTQAMHRLSEQAHPAFPVTIFYAFKQSESDGEAGIASTGWDTFLDAVIRAGFSVSGTWPVRTERSGGFRNRERSSLASSIVLVCRPRDEHALTATRREFVTHLRAELPAALVHLQRGNIAPVDLAQAAIGPGMAVYTRFARVLDAEGRPLSVRDALVLINQTLDEALAEQEGDFEAESRWAVAWFSDHGFSDGPFGDAHTYFLRYNTAENALKQAGIIESGRGRVRLLRPDELRTDWDPTTDSRLTAWEMVHYLVRALEAGGESAAATIVANLGAKAETARELAYRLYSISERKKRAAEAISYNSLVQSWPEISLLARESSAAVAAQGTLFGASEE